MEIILKKDFKNLGSKDDLVKVKSGYGRNYLIPQGFAMLATPPAKKMWEETMKQRAFKVEKIKEEALKKVDAIKSLVIKVGVKVGDQGKIFGSVTNLQLAEAFSKLGYEIDRHDITLKEDSIKETGEYQAEIKFHKDITETFTFEVVGE